MAQFFSEHEWLYPDTPITRENGGVSLHAARGGSVCFQVLTEHTLPAPEDVTVRVENAAPVRLTVSQLLPATVDLNSARDMLCTRDYDSVKDFVTRKAPFQVFDVLSPLTEGKLQPGRAAFWVRLDVPQECLPGLREIGLEMRYASGGFSCRVALQVHAALVPDYAHARFGMINWLFLDRLDRAHGVGPGDPRREKILRAYLVNQLDMRNTDLMIPSGKPVRDESGALTGFDFSDAELVGNMALDMGFHRILGGFVARFKNWDDPTHFLLWDRETSVAGMEGYRQLSLYFRDAWACVLKNGWREKYVQCLVDEPQFPNSEHYRILCGIARKRMPGVVIHDPVESTELFGGPDIWCVKQAVYEKYIDTYRRLQAMGEEMWLYTCGFPGGWVMNRVMDLPLTVSRLPFWMCALYRCKGFLHWGYNALEEDWKECTCMRPEPDHDEIAYPAGNAHIVVPGEDGPLDGVRAQLQRMGAEDAELLYQLIDRDPDRADAIIRSVARSFSDYDPSPEAMESARIALLEALDGLGE